MNRIGRHNGFTLVELLVVIAIITILAAMLLPTLENALAMSRDTSCKSNMQQICISEGLYSNEENDCFAYAPNSEEYYEILARRGYAQNVWPAYPSNVPQWARPRGVWACPSVKMASVQSGDRYIYDADAWRYLQLAKGLSAGGESWYAGSYVLNYSPNIKTRTNYPVTWETYGYGETYGAYACSKFFSIPQMRQHSRVFLSTDGVSYRYTDPYGLDSTDPSNFIYARHGGHMNVSFWDLHVGQARYVDYLHSGNVAAELSRLKADGFPYLRAPHGKINSAGAFRPISPAQY